MLEIKDGRVSLNKSRVLTPKQMSILSRFTRDIDKTQYLMSIMGLVKQRLSVNRLKRNGWNTLADKHPNTYADRMKSIKNLNNGHAPSERGLGQWVGVEIECFIPHEPGDCYSDCRNDCPEGECECSTGHWSTDEAHSWLKTQLRDAGVHRVNVKEDGSLSDDEGHGVELTILFNSAYGFGPLERLCSALKKAGCYVNKTCGLHVHLDARNKTLKKVTACAQSLGNALPVIKWLVPETRHDNTYCKLGVSPARGDRYFAINLTAFRKYKTVEIRLHSGSINAEKITNWVKVLQSVANAKLKAPIKTFQELLDIPGIDDKMAEYADKRISELNPTAWMRLNPEEFSEFTPKVVIAPTPLVDQRVFPSVGGFSRRNRNLGIAARGQGAVAPL